MKALEYGACALIQKPALGTKQYFEESRMMIYEAILQPIRVAENSAATCRLRFPNQELEDALHIHSQSSTLM